MERGGEARRQRVGKVGVRAGSINGGLGRSMRARYGRGRPVGVEGLVDVEGWVDVTAYLP